MQALSSLQRETAMCTLPAKDSSRKTLIRLQLASGYDHVRGAWMRSCCRIYQHESINLLLQKEVTSI
ncbi:unnamed protein product [Brassica oleracea]